MTSTWKAVAAAALAATALVAAVAPAHGARGLQLGITDDILLNEDTTTRAFWMDRTRDTRTDSVLLAMVWADIAPTDRQPGFNARNPGDPGYRWDVLDDGVRDATARDLDVMIMSTAAPGWAEGPNRPSVDIAASGTWKPDPGAIRDFAQALATRYSGTFPDPENPGRPLPQVSEFQGWAEPNYSVTLTPQWEAGVPAAAIHYRAMLNAFYAGIKAVNPANRVVSAGTAPYGDPVKGGLRMPPALFWREVLCLKGKKLRKTKCSDPVHLDVVAHHPINVGAPRRAARYPQDISTPDMAKLREIMDKASRARTLLPGGRKPLWATEIWWESNPPDPGAISQGRQARWLAEALYLLWKQGVGRVIWHRVADTIPSQASPTLLQSGLFLRSGVAKPSYAAFRFPFVAEAAGKRVEGRGGARSVTVWGMAPGAGKVRIQVLRRGRWGTVARVSAGGNRVFSTTLRLHGKPRLRAVANGESSLVWKLN